MVSAHCPPDDSGTISSIALIEKETGPGGPPKRSVLFSERPILKVRNPLLLSSQMNTRELPISGVRPSVDGASRCITSTFKIGLDHFPAVPSIYSIVPPNDGSALRHGHHFEPVDFVIDHGRGHHDAYSAGSCQRAYARACGCRQRPRCHREELIESERGWSGREAFVTMMQTADLGQGNDRSRPGRLNGSSIRCVLAERQVGP